ncbi:glycoside hydrolase domain-containing protein [Streptomyces cinnamoneus]|nr:glycoside hydrolase domain-containing protein [Streptomyces cinnamoneus]
MSSKHVRGLATLVAAAAVLAAPLVSAGSALAATPAGQGGAPVSYQGLSLDVPAGWNVVNLDDHPDTCVRLDQKTLYLGHPGANQNCPTHLVGQKTDALVVEPVSGAAPRPDVPTVNVAAGQQVPGTLPTDDGREVRVAFEGAGLFATASYEGSTAAVQKILSSAKLDKSAKPAAAPKPSRAPLAAAAAAVTPSTGFTGKAFDACAAPSNSTMSDWADSPYRGVGIYIGGPTRVCAQPNLTSSWVQTQTRAGWHMLPIYAGTQAAGISSGNATGQGRAAAEKAVELAKDLGFAPGTVLYVDMENYSPGYRANVLNYLSGWSDRIRELGFRSGVYGSASSAMKDLSSVYNNDSYHRPDVVWSANWNSKADTDDSYIPDGYWSHHQRVHQYAGEVSESHGGTQLNIDRDYVDVAPSLGDPGMTQLTAGDLNADGKKDVVAVKVETGELFLYPNTGKSGLDMLGDRVLIGTGGWNGMKDLTVGDFNGDGKDDLVATKAETGELFLYPGTGKKSLEALDDRALIGTGGWNGMKGLFAGDFNGDGKTDLGAVKSETGELFLYPGTGKKSLEALDDRVLIGTGGWNGMNKLAAGDFNKDGKPDLVATKTETGELFLYPGTGKKGLDTLGDRTQIGTGGWNGISDYAAADFTGDGIADLAAVDSDRGETGKLYLYKGNGKGLDSRTEIGTGGW